MNKLLLFPQLFKIPENGLVAEYDFATGSGQVLLNKRNPSTNGILGATSGVELSDPVWGIGLNFSVNKYVKLPYMINAEQDFAVYIATNIGASNPVANETYFSMGNSGSATQYASVRRDASGNLTSVLKNNAGSVITPAITTANLIFGIRVIKFQRESNVVTLKDIGSSRKPVGINAPSNPITFNEMALGCQFTTSAASFLNQPEYYCLIYNRAVTDSEDSIIFKTLKKSLSKRGITLS